MTKRQKPSDQLGDAGFATGSEAERRVPLDQTSLGMSAVGLPSLSVRVLGAQVTAMSQVHDDGGNAGSTLEAVPSRETQFRPPAIGPSDVGDGGARVVSVDEALRRLLSRRELNDDRPLPRSIGVVSPSGGEGVSTVATALANILRADYGLRVCLLNFSDPEAESTAAAKPGLLAEVASGRMPIESIESLDFDTLDFGSLTAPQWHALAHSEAFAQGLEALRRRRDHLVFDAPPVLASSRSMVVLRRVDAYVLVARHGVTSIGDVKTTVEALAGLESLGSVLNCHRSRVPRRFARQLSTS